MDPIGHLKSVFKFKNGTPRQAGVCSTARGILTINKSVFNNPEHSLEGLEEFSHAWIIFIFHKNNNACVKAKVRPPRLNGKRIGVFATRAPYRPNPIGLTLAKIERISGAEIHFSGIDLLDGTPVLDVKPFIPQYDDPACNSMIFQSSCNVDNSSSEDVETSVDQFPRTDQVSSFSEIKTKFDKQVKVDQVFSSSQLEKNADHLLGTDQLQASVNQLKKTDQMSIFAKVVQNENQSLRSDSETSTEHYLPLPTSTGHLSIPTTNVSAKLTHSDKQTFKESYKEDTCSVGEDSYQPHASVSKDSDPSKLPDCHNIDECFLSKDSIHLERDDSVCESWVNPANHLDIQASCNQVTKPTITASWVTRAPISKLTVIFTLRAKEQMLNFTEDSDNPAFRLQYLQNKNEVYQAISDILAEDPRSIYRRNSCKDSLYHFAVDSVHVTCWFFDQFAEILFIQPASYVPQTRGS